MSDAAEVAPVLLGRPGESGTAGPDLTELARRARECAGRARPALDLAREVGEALPLPAGGGTAARWEALATLAAADLTAARVAEAHTDALAILAEHGDRAAAGTTWGVFAAEAPGARLDAEPAGGTGGSGERGWHLRGTKPWCSLADQVSDALVTARTPAGRRLFHVDLRASRSDGTARVHPGAEWVARGLVEVTSTSVAFDRAAAAPVGDAGWYLRRPGFAWGGLGVAACWYGGAVGVARRLLRSTAERPPDQVALVHVGALDVALARTRALLAEAAADVDAGRADAGAGAALATRVRSAVVDAAEEALTRVGHALGPAPLAFDADHARRVADLEVYLRQHHGERDLADLGEAVLVAGTSW